MFHSLHKACSDKTEEKVGVNISHGVVIEQLIDQIHNYCVGAVNHIYHVINLTLNLPEWQKKNYERVLFAIG